jgi:hypothetical protein
MLYFGYGSNLNPRQMAQRCPGHRVAGVALLTDHRLEFRGLSEDWGGAVATLVPSHGAAVWGLLFELTEEHLQTLDRYEGFRAPGDQHNLYERGTVTVELVRPLDGSVPRRVRAQAYTARHGAAGLPSRRYLDTILEGARHHHLPEEYVEKLAAAAATEEGG